MAVGNRRRQLRIAAASFALATSSLLLLAGTSTSARAATSTVQADDVAEAWYSSVPVSSCQPPLPCPPSPVPSNPYPADTLHVGVVGGRETARTYVRPDLSVLPFDAVVSSAVMTLPVASNPQDGSIRPETGTIKACFVTQPFTDGAAGSSAKPPAYDANACVPAKYAAPELSFLVDLSTFFTRWLAGVTNNGVALVPDTSKATPATAWHVTFNGRDRANALHISSVFQYTEAPAVALPPLEEPTLPPVVALPPVAGPPLSVGAPPVPAPVQPPAVAPPPQQRPVAVRVPGSYQYPAAFLLPLAFLAAGVFLVRLFTADPIPSVRS